MNFDDDNYGEIMNAHKELWEGKYFNVSAIITPPKCWISIIHKSEEYEKIAERAKDNKIFNVVVMENNEPIGFINVKYLEKGCWGKLSKIDDYSIEETQHLTQTVNRMYKDAEKIIHREESPLYFSFKDSSGKRKYNGIFTFWDLNRGPSYVLSYLGLVYLEHTLLEKIRDSHKDKEFKSHRDVIEKCRKSVKYKREIEYIESVFTEEKYEFKRLSTLGLAGMAAFYKNDTCINRDKNLIPDDLLESMLSNSHGIFRNRIGHTIKLLVEDNDRFKSDLKNLKNIWNFTEHLFANFKDPKVRYQLMNDCRGSWD